MRIKRMLPEELPKSQGTLLPFEEKQAKLEMIIDAQEKVFSAMKLHPELKIDEHALGIVLDRTEREGGEAGFEKKAAELYAHFFMIENGWEMWESKVPKIKEEFLKALKKTGE